MVSTRHNPVTHVTQRDSISDAPPRSTSASNDWRLKRLDSRKYRVLRFSIADRYLRILSEMKDRAGGEAHRSKIRAIPFPPGVGEKSRATQHRTVGPDRTAEPEARIEQ
ncbi:uncharacterized protein LOC100906430 [Galendromus occidentalis]|uniref:Uncharacterized protein LOC100906430 n=1 Tax=Galendromus occidentalis TaxID=34638 RepID=A0AAJ6QMG8_9ACAR|nr:uncharacterized protein LOC100906430 [Galendromus occidentalis]